MNALTGQVGTGNKLFGNPIYQELPLRQTSASLPMFTL